MSLSTSRAEAMPSNAQTDREAYLGTLLAAVQAGVPEGLLLPDLRRAAEAMVREQTFPHTQQEEWRFTDLSAMLPIAFKVSQTPPAIAPADLEPVVLPEAPARLVFVNGIYSAALSSLDNLPQGITVQPLTALQGSEWEAAIAARLGQQSGNHEVFTALNTAGFQDAAVIWVTRNQIIEQPIQVIHLALPDSAATLGQPRCLVVAEAGSALTLVEDFWGTASEDHFTNSVSEIWVDANAQVNHVRLQREGGGTFHVGKTAVTQARDSRYAVTAIDLGARLGRHHLEVYQSGPQTDTRLHGLSAIVGQQLADTHSLIALTHPHGTAEQLQKCIVDDRAHAVFNGKIWVPREAQLTNASQLNRNLLLSGKGRVDTKPELDIVANNVQCAHGATVSQLDDSEVFYLQSRGIRATQAQRLLIYGFAMEIIEQIPLTSLRDALTQTITGWTREQATDS